MTKQKIKLFDGNCKHCRIDDDKCFQCINCGLVICQECAEEGIYKCQYCSDKEVNCPSCYLLVIKNELDYCKTCKKEACYYCLADEMYEYGTCDACNQIEYMEGLCGYNSNGMHWM